MSRTPVAPEVRVMQKVVHGDVPVLGEPCWVFTGSLGHAGYPQVGIGSRTDGSARVVRAHRLMYEVFVGPIPDGLEVDHLCDVRSCVNPAHLEAATHRANTLRGTNPCALNARKSACKHGHEFTEENVYRKANGARECRACRRRRDKQRSAA